MYITQTHQERLGHLAAAWWKQSGRSLEAAAVRFPTHQFLQQPLNKADGSLHAACPPAAVLAQLPPTYSPVHQKISKGYTPSLRELLPRHLPQQSEVPCIPLKGACRQAAHEGVVEHRWWCRRTATPHSRPSKTDIRVTQPRSQGSILGLRVEETEKDAQEL